MRCLQCGETIDEVSLENRQAGTGRQSRGRGRLRDRVSMENRESKGMKASDGPATLFLRLFNWQVIEFKRCDWWRCRDLNPAN